MVYYCEYPGKDALEALDAYVSRAMQSASDATGAWYAVQFGSVSENTGETYYPLEFELGRRVGNELALAFNRPRIDCLRVHIDMNAEVLHTLDFTVRELVLDENMEQNRSYVLSSGFLGIEFDVGVGGAFIVHHQQFAPYAVNIVRLGGTVKPRNMFLP